MQPNEEFYQLAFDSTQKNLLNVFKALLSCHAYFNSSIKLADKNLFGRGITIFLGVVIKNYEKDNFETLTGLKLEKQGTIQVN